MVGHGHPLVASTQNNIALVYEQQGMLEKALEMHSAVLETRTRVFGANSLHVADTRYNMASLHKERGERDVASQLFLECEAIYAKVYGPDHSETKDAAQQARRCE